LPAVILDSTLREGELFRVFPLDKKLRIAEMLVEAGIRRVEVTVHYPPKTSYEENARVVKLLKDRGAEVVMHGRAYQQDIESMMMYDLDGVAVYLAVSQIHLDHKLGGIGHEEAKRKMLEAVEAVRPFGLKYVRVTYEDASRLFRERDLQRLDDMLSFSGQLKSAGATLISLPDTAGLMTPNEAGEFIAYCAERSALPVACHFHNDYGLASANTIKAILAGASEAHTTLLGIGDRNGIADLYEVVAPLQDVYGHELGVRREVLARVYREFSRLTGIPIPWRHPLSEEASTIRAGVHQSMVIRRPEGYLPPMKIKHDIRSIKFAITPYMSHKLILEIAHLDGLELSDSEARTIVGNLVAKLLHNGKRASPRELAKHLSDALGRPISESLVRKFFGEEKAYLLLKLRPQADTGRIVSELSRWEEVESIDEVYGSVDLVLRAKLRINGQTLVDRLRSTFARDIEEINVLITD
jgi:isopropylmalate/homocitrate/citramalate synthase